MSNRILWGVIVILGFAYFVFPPFKNANEIIKRALHVGNEEEMNLSLIKTSPRWKFPYSSHNASLNKGNYEFQFSTLPIISISIEEDAFFGYSKGIYIRGAKEWKETSNDLPWWDWPANYRQRGREWERKAEIEFIGFEKPLRKKVEIRINGNATRAFPQKSLRLIFNKEAVENIFYPNEPENTFKTMLLRNGGNDWDRAMMRDVIVAKVSKNLHLETQEAIACNVYLNGEYWGIHYLRPKLDADYLSKHYTIDSDNISILESPMNIYRGSKTGLDDFKSLLNYIGSNNMKDSINYTEVSSRLDIESLIDYLLVQIFIVNTDWPQNNWMVWRDLTNSYNNGKWKWILKDTDYGLGFFDRNSFTYDMLGKIKSNKGAIGIIYSGLMENAEFQKKFLERKNMFFDNNWSRKNFNHIVDSSFSVLSPEMKFQIDRWRTHNSYKQWEMEVKEMSDFYSKRLEHF